jgi:hypothetical protein
MLQTELSPVLSQEWEPAVPEPAVDLGRLLEPGCWEFCTDPFPHVRAGRVFTAEFHRELTAAFDAILRGEQWPAWPEACFRRNMPGYDASAADLNGRVGWPFTVFVSRPWHDLFAGLFAMPVNDCMGGALHHHAPGSADGYLHNDFCPGWFAAGGEPGDIVVADCDRCNYCYGTTPAGSSGAVRETVRAIAILYYVNNPEWAPGDGGETGLYRAAGDEVDQAVVSVPPIDNSLLAFECSPHSFHTFRSNRRPRNSVIVWLHREKADALAQWGEGSIVPWPVRTP